jgi:hypothetical protein
MPVKGTYLAIAGVGAIFLWSGLTGKSWSQILRYVISGQNPTQAEATQATSQVAALDAASSNTGGNVTGPANASETAWITALFTALGVPATQANISSMSAWIAKETPWPPVASNNPLNTTQSAAGATTYNSAGVKNYPNAAVGLSATVATLHGYPAIIARLRTGQGLCGWTSDEFSTWSGGGYSGVC